MLYGVTMQEKGVSTVLALDMEEALQTHSLKGENSHGIL